MEISTLKKIGIEPSGAARFYVLKFLNGYFLKFLNNHRELVNYFFRELLAAPIADVKRIVDMGELPPKPALPPDAPEAVREYWDNLGLKTPFYRITDSYGKRTDVASEPVSELLSAMMLALNGTDPEKGYAVYSWGELQREKKENGTKKTRTKKVVAVNKRA